MSITLEALDAKLDAVLSAVADMKRPAPEAPMTIKAFAKRVGMSRWTIQNRIRSHDILTKQGRIPPSELRKFGL